MYILNKHKLNKAAISHMVVLILFQWLMLSKGLYGAFFSIIV